MADSKMTARSENKEQMENSFKFKVFCFSFREKEKLIMV